MSEYNTEKAALIAELQEAGIKHSPEKIVRVAKKHDGTIVFLEEGKGGKRGSGLAHILEKHSDNGYIVGANPASLP